MKMTKQRIMNTPSAEQNKSSAESVKMLKSLCFFFMACLPCAKPAFCEKKGE